MKNVLTLLSLFLFLTPVFSQPEDANIIITNRTETYEYYLQGSQVMVKQKITTAYECTKMPESITVYEMYDDESTINKVKVKGIRGVTPKYNLYESNDIFYSDAKICHFKLFFDKKGKTAEVEIEKTYKDPRYFTSAYFPEEEYMIGKTVNFIVPEWMNVELNEYNFDGYNIQKNVSVQDKTTHYKYFVSNVDALKKESQMRGPSHVYPHIFVINKSAVVNGRKTVFFETVADRYKWCYDIITQAGNDEAIISNTANEIVKGCTTDMEKIKTLFGWVQDNIRYVAFEDGIAGFKPDDSHEVLRKKYGDCKGMSFLLKCFLQSQGFDARMAWIGTNRIAYDYSTPSLAVDNHMICALFHEGETYYLDATVEYMPLGEYPSTIQGRQVMIEDGDNFILNHIPTFPPQLNTDSLYCSYTIDNGVLKGNAVWIFKGEAKQLIMSLIHSTPKDKLNPTLKYFVERGNVQDKAADVSLHDASAQSKAVSISYTIENNSGIQTLNNEYYIDLNPHKALNASTVDIKKRKNDILMRYQRYDVMNVLMEIPEGYEVTHLPENFSLEKDKYRFSINYEKQDNKILYTCKIVIYDPLIKKSEFETWNADIEALKKNYRDQIALTKQ